MAYRKKQFVPPAMRLHASGQAVVEWERECFYLGKYGTAAASQAYLRLLVHLEERFHAKAAGVTQPTRTEALLVDEAIFRYLHHLEHDEDGDLLPDGSISSHFDKARWHLRPLSAAFGDMFVTEFSAADLKALRKLARSGQWDDAASPWSTGYCNSAIANVRRFFAWLESEGLVSPGKAEHLATVKPLRTAGNTEPKTVDDATLDAVCLHACPTVAAMIRLQRLTAARPSEICVMRPCDIDRSRDVWVYRPESHKTAYLGKDRAIPLGATCQAILTPFLDRPDGDYLFDPAEALEWWWCHKTGKQSPDRKTKVYASELRRRARLKEERRRQRARKRRCAPRYTRQTYRQAVLYAIDRARNAGESVPHWYPYMLRHTRLTEVQDQYGWDDAAAVAGHESVNTTKRYAHLRHERALRIAEGTQRVQPVTENQAESSEDEDTGRKLGFRRRQAGLSQKTASFHILPLDQQHPPLGPGDVGGLHGDRWRGVGDIADCRWRRRNGPGDAGAKGCHDW